MGYRCLYTKTLLLTISLLVSSCASETTPLLRVGTNMWPGYEPFYLARSLGQLSNEQIRLVEYPSSTEVLRAFRNKSIEVAALTLDEVLLLIQDKVKLKIFLVLDISHGGDVMMSHPDITTMSDLKGKRVGVENTALGAYVLTRALQVHNITLEEIEIIPAEISDHERVFSENKVDAVVTFDPVRTKLRTLGAREIFSSKEIPGEIVDVVVVHEDYLNAYPKRVRNLVDGWFEAIEYMQENQQQSAAILAERQKISVAEVIASYDGIRIPGREENITMLSEGSNGMLNNMQRLNDTLVQHNLIHRKLEIGDKLTADVVRQ